MMESRLKGKPEIGLQAMLPVTLSPYSNDRQGDSEHDAASSLQADSPTGAICPNDLPEPAVSCRRLLLSPACWTCWSHAGRLRVACSV
jgi:hypothetical protein